MKATKLFKDFLAVDSEKAGGFVLTACTKFYRFYLPTQILKQIIMTIFKLNLQDTVLNIGLMTA